MCEDLFLLNQNHSLQTRKTITLSNSEPMSWILLTKIVVLYNDFLLFIGLHDRLSSLQQTKFLLNKQLISVLEIWHKLKLILVTLLQLILSSPFINLLNIQCYSNSNYSSNSLCYYDHYHVCINVYVWSYATAYAHIPHSTSNVNRSNIYWWIIHLPIYIRLNFIDCFRFALPCRAVIRFDYKSASVFAHSNIFASLLQFTQCAYNFIICAVQWWTVVAASCCNMNSSTAGLYTIAVIKVIDKQNIRFYLEAKPLHLLLKAIYENNKKF